MEQGDHAIGRPPSRPSGGTQPRRPGRVAIIAVAGAVVVLGGSLLITSGPAMDQNDLLDWSAYDFPPSPPPDTAPSDPATILMYVLSDEYPTSGGSPAEAALNTVVRRRDTRFVPVLIELVRANQLSVSRGAGLEANVAALESLSARSFGADWPAWVEWYGQTDLRPPPGFTGWKGRLLGRIDPGFEEFLPDGVEAGIRVEEVLWGGVSVDGIPALDRPPVLPAEKAGYLQPGEPVFGISIGGESRAYPLRIMDWHEMANDVVGGVPFSLAYCTLCGSGIAFDQRAADGMAFTFGSSGLLYRSNKLMYDRQTRSLWNQFTGEPVIGDLVGTGIRLRRLPVVVTSWQAWREQHPETTVLDISTGFDRRYELGAAYGEYFASAATLFPVPLRSERLPPKERVYGLTVGDASVAYPVGVLSSRRVTNDVVGTTPVTLVATRGSLTVHPDGAGADSVYEVGGEVRAYASGGRLFRPGPDPGAVLDAAGAEWAVTEGALVGPEGEQLVRLNGIQSYWFAWFQFFPRTDVYGEA